MLFNIGSRRWYQEIVIVQIKGSITVRHKDEANLVATFRHIVVVVVGHHPMDAKGQQAQVDACNAHARRTGEGKLIEIVILDPEVALPNGEVRTILDGNVPVITPYYACVATLFEASGFRASIIRGLLTSFSLLSRTSFPQKLFSDANAAALYIASHQEQLAPEERLSPQEILELIADVKEIAREAGILSA